MKLKHLKWYMALFGAIDGVVVWWSQGKFAEIIYKIFIQWFTTNQTGVLVFIIDIIIVGLVWFGLGILLEKLISKKVKW